MKKLRRYTKPEHVRRLKIMLNRENPCGCCPAAPKFSAAKSASLFWVQGVESICKTCRDFLGELPGHHDATGPRKCPCLVLGHEEALKRTHLAIEQYDGGRSKK